MTRPIFAYSHSVTAFYNDPTYRPTFYQHFHIALRDDPENPLYEIITNGAGEGLWIYADGEYYQIDAAYHVPGTAQALRAALRSGLRITLEARSYLTEQEAAILNALRK